MNPTGPVLRIATTRPKDGSKLNPEVHSPSAMRQRIRLFREVLRQRSPPAVCGFRSVLTLFGFGLRRVSVHWNTSLLHNFMCRKRRQSQGPTLNYHNLLACRFYLYSLIYRTRRGPPKKGRFGRSRQALLLILSPTGLCWYMSLGSDINET